MASQSSRGNYYKRKTRDWFREQGYYVELTEFTTTRFLGKGKPYYVKVDVLGSDGIAMNGEEIIFWNSKHNTTNDENNIRIQILDAKKTFAQFPFPPSVKRCAIMWIPRIKEPRVYYF